MTASKKSPCGAKSRDANATRDAILCAAYTHFVKDGYDKAGVRAIASEAGIDPALICRYFGSKKQLFAEVLDCLSEDPMEVLAGATENCGKRIAEALFKSDNKAQKRLTFIELVTRSIASEEANKLVHQHIEKHFVHPVAKWLGGKGSSEKAWAIASVLMGWLILDRARPKNKSGCKQLAATLQAIVDQQ